MFTPDLNMINKIRVFSCLVGFMGRPLTALA